MPTSFLSLVKVALGLSLVPVALGTTYNLVDNYVGSSFLSEWNHEAIADPTHGRVNYVDQGTAIALNLTYASGSSLVLRTDSKTVLSPSGPGRNSVRIRTNKAYTQHVAIFNINHMPQGCATWPAVWETYEPNWPYAGEIDILEGTNDVVPNQSTLHTSDGCTMPASRLEQGTVAGTDCSAFAPGNPGCGVKNGKANSYGPAFNNAGGGWYAVERTTTFVRVFFWSRHEAGVPRDVSSATPSINPDNWGTPVALFPNTSCDINAKFGVNNIIINTSLCGDWAGQAAVFNGAGCPGDCVSHVNDNPAAFANAYWDIASVRVYT